jgi:hypothetical protein
LPKEKQLAFAQKLALALKAYPKIAAASGMTPVEIISAVRGIVLGNDVGEEYGPKRIRSQQTLEDFIQEQTGKKGMSFEASWEEAINRDAALIQGAAPIVPVPILTEGLSLAEALKYYQITESLELSPMAALGLLKSKQGELILQRAIEGDEPAIAEIIKSVTKAGRNETQKVLTKVDWDEEDKKNCPGLPRQREIEPERGESASQCFLRKQSKDLQKTGPCPQLFLELKLWEK